MRIKLLLSVAIGAVLMFGSAARATDLRGRVDGFNPYTQLRGPLPGIAVALFATYPNGQYVLVRQVVTGIDGMYYLVGVYPGQYILQVGGLNYPLVVGVTQLQDVPIITR
jgi:hypothetical protein